MDPREKVERRILKISLFSGIGFVVLELCMALYSKSQSILMDTAFDAAELIVILASLLLTPLLYRPVTERRPFGYSQCENLFIVVKGFMMLGIMISLISNNIQLMLSGGNHVNTTLVSGFELLLTLFSLLVLMVLRYYGKKLQSPLIMAEIYGWKIDVLCGFGVSLAFLVPLALGNTPLAGIAPYFDQIVAITLGVMMLPEPVKMVLHALHDILLFAPEEETMETIKAISQPICGEHGLKIVFIDSVRTGRRTWVSLTLRSNQENWYLPEIRKVYHRLRTELEKQFEDVDLELIPELE